MGVIFPKLEPELSGQYTEVKTKAQDVTFPGFPALPNSPCKVSDCASALKAARGLPAQRPSYGRQSNKHSEDAELRCKEVNPEA